MKGYRVVVCGEVQGVGFRASVRRHALKLGLQGYARNLPDGCVEIVLATDKRELVEELIESLKSLRTARITSVNVTEATIEQPIEGFTIS